MPPRKRRQYKKKAGKYASVKRISGRKIELVLFKQLKAQFPKWIIYRYNENRHNATPADMFIQTRKYDINMEVKATSGISIQGSNVRTKQRETLTTFHNFVERNLGIIALYYQPKQSFILIDIVTFLKHFNRGAVKYDKVKEFGYEIKHTKGVLRYFVRVAKGKKRISSAK